MERQAEFNETGLTGTSGTIYALLWRHKADLAGPVLISWLLLLALKIAGSLLQFPAPMSALSHLGKGLLLIGIGLLEMAVPLLLYVAILIPLAGGRPVARLNPIGKPDKLGRLLLVTAKKYLALAPFLVPLILAYVFQRSLGGSFTLVVVLIALPTFIGLLYLLYRLMFVIPAVVHEEAKPMRFSWNATRGEVGGLFLASVATGLPIAIPRMVVAIVGGRRALANAILRSDLAAVAIDASVDTLLSTATMVLSALTIGVCYNVLVRNIPLPEQHLGIGRA